MDFNDDGFVKISEKSAGGVKTSVKQVSNASVVGKTSHHPHPVQPESKVRTERVVTAVKPGTEGCDEHYNVREVVTDLNFAPEEKHPSVLAYDLVRTMTIGEALANPRFKNPFRFKK